jgi:DNA replication protein DnaC
VCRRWHHGHDHTAFGCGSDGDAAQLERLSEHLHKLQLQKSAECLEALLQRATADELPYADFLEQVLGEEVAAMTAKNISMRTAMARFRIAKPLETFDFTCRLRTTSAKCGRWRAATTSSTRTP